MKTILCEVVYLDSLCPSQQIFSHISTMFCLPLMNPYYAERKVCLAEGHVTVTLQVLRLELTALRSPV